MYDLNSPNPFERRIEEISRSGVLGERLNQLLSEFLKKMETEGDEKINVTVAITRRSHFKIPFDELTPEEQQKFKKQEFFPNEQGQIEVNFDPIFSSHTTSPGQVVITHKARSLNLEDVRNFLRKLRIAKILHSRLIGGSYPIKTFFGVILFSEAISEVNPEAIEEASRRGLFLIYIPENPEDIENLTLEQLELRNSNPFQLSSF